MRNVLDKSCKENQKTHFMLNDFFLNRSVYEIMSKNVVEPERPQVASQYATCYMHERACTCPRASAHTRTRARAHTHAHKYVILLFHGNSSYVVRSFSVLFYIILFTCGWLKFCQCGFSSSVEVQGEWVDIWKEAILISFKAYHGI